MPDKRIPMSAGELDRTRCAISLAGSKPSAVPPFHGVHAIDHGRCRSARSCCHMLLHDGHDPFTAAFPNFRVQRH
jgi:hypothetical protein